jgi:Flp pilus assembly protein TadG
MFRAFSPDFQLIQGGEMRERSSAIDRPRSTMSRLASGRAGNVTVLFGMSVLVLISVTGGAVDFARWFNAKNRMQQAIDAAALAGGRALQVSATNDTAVAIAAAQQYFEKMMPADLATATPTFTVIENGTVLKGEIDYRVPTYFLGMMGITGIEAKLVTEAVLAAGGNAGTNLEIALMLDTTGSMAGQKIEDLKLAAKDLVDIVVWSDQSQYTSKIALAPFSVKVNVGSYLSEVTDVPASRQHRGSTQYGITCVTERTGAEAFSDAKPAGTNMLSANSGDKGTTATNNSSNYSSTGECKTSGRNGVIIPQIMPLTSDTGALKTAIDGLPAAGSTAGALGTAWAWYLLSPKWEGIWTGTSLPAPYSDITTLGPKGAPKLQKVAVLMTDGIYNTTGGQSYGDTSSMAQTISQNAVTLCNNMKAAGIKIFTVGFDLGANQLAIDTLKACASRDANDPADSPSYFYSAATGSELRGAFRQIALQLSTLRLRM